MVPPPSTTTTTGYAGAAYTEFKFKKMNGNSLQFEENPIEDVISRIRFPPASNNLLISYWDTFMESKEIVEDMMYPITSKWV
ncbi:hypothetical protein L2E82_03175 [Cichorium intybus]|uniref:Uncharacterized protein n=1 Tax=Cichorium intybus TaxID=13427 RepID=A0ACB9H495_CICIN|nr:hypothetical protein L2E82_03175 [Cichorium intybus]